MQSVRVFGVIFAQVSTILGAICVLVAKHFYLLLPYWKISARCCWKSFLERVQWVQLQEIPPDLDPRIPCPWSKGALQSERLHVGLEREHRRLGGGRWSCEAGCWWGCASGGGEEVELGAGFLLEYTEVLKKEARSVGLKGFWERGGWSFTTTTWNCLGRGLKAQSKSQREL